MQPESASVPKRGLWRRFYEWLGEVSEAMDVSYDELQDRRILALEKEVAELRRTSSRSPD